MERMTDVQDSNEPGRRLTGEDGKSALADHVRIKGLAARERYPDLLDPDGLDRLLADRDIVRHPLRIVFDSGPLQRGEIGFMEAEGTSPKDGFRLSIHPRFSQSRGIIAAITTYWIVRVDYGDIASAEEAELFGSMAMGLERESYYALLCAAADSLLP